MNNLLNNIYNSDIDNKIKLLEINQIKKKMYNSEFLNQFDDLKFNNISEPVSIMETNITDKGKNFFLERDIDFQRGYSQFELNNTHYDIFHPDEFTHNNMIPNTNKKDTYINYSIPQRTLETFTGVSDTYVKKKEKKPLFDPLSDLTWVNGMPSFSGILKTRYLPSNKNNNGNLPFDANIRIKPGVDNINQDGTYNVYRINPQTVDTLRSNINQKISYNNIIKEVIKKGEKRASTPNLTKYKLPDFRENTFDTLIPTKSQFDKGQMYGQYTNTDTMRNLSQNYQPGPANNSNMGDGPNKNKYRFEPSKKESYYNDPTHGINSVNVRPVMNNINSCNNYDNQRTTTNYQQQGNINNNTITYHIDYNDIPLTTIKELSIHNDNINNISSIQKQNYIFSNDMILPITNRIINNNNDILGPNNNINKPQLYNNDKAKQTIKENTSHNIVSNTQSLINQSQLYNNDNAKPTIKENSSHNIVSNIQSLVNQSQLYNNDNAKPTIKENSSHNIVSNIQSLINQSQLYNNDNAKPTIKENSSHNIVSNIQSLINQSQLYNNDKAKQTIKENSSHNIVSNIQSLINQSQLYNNDNAKQTIKETTSYNIVSNIQSLINQSQLYNNDNAKPTIKETTIDNNYQSNINGDNTIYIKNYNDILRPTIKESLIYNNYVGNVNNSNNIYTQDYNDKTRQTIKETTIENNYNSNINYKNGDIYVKDINDKLKPTIKETTIYNLYDSCMNATNINYIKNKDNAKTTIKETTILNDYTGILHNDINKQISHLASNNMCIDERKEDCLEGRIPGGKKDLNGPMINKNNVKLITPIHYNYVAPPHIGLDNNIMPSFNKNELDNYNNKKPIIETDNTNYHINKNINYTLKNNPYINNIIN